MQENNKTKRIRKGRELIFKLLLWLVTFGSHFKRVVLATTSTILLQATSFAFLFQAFPNFDYGVSAK
jgi:hypothetical protein